jgi:hypothetical protein
VIFKEFGTLTATPDGRHMHRRAVQIADPQARHRSGTAAGAYSAAGRSVYTDALAAGFSPAEARQQARRGPMDEPPIASSGCVHSEDVEPSPDFSWDGCYKLYDASSQDANAWYAAGSGTAHGWGTGVLGGGKELDKGYSQITWSGDGAEIIEASPGANQQGTSNCGSFTIGLSQYIGVSYTAPLCADGWDVTWNPTVHKVEWHGASAGGSSDTRAASGASTVRLPLSTPTVYLDYEIGWTYTCFC